MNLERIGNFIVEYREHRRAKAARWADTFFNLASVAGLIFAAVGLYVASHTGNDANTYSIFGIGAMLSVTFWEIANMKRFAAQRARESQMQ